MASTLDKDKLHEVLDEAVIVIDAADLERSRSDPRVAAFHDSAESLLLELEAEGAEYSETAIAAVGELRRLLAPAP
jgi:hypothetical protein